MAQALGQVADDFAPAVLGLSQYRGAISKGCPSPQILGSQAQQIADLDC